MNNELREWLRRLVHISSCPATYSEQYLRGYIESAKILADLEK